MSRSRPVRVAAVLVAALAVAACGSPAAPTTPVAAQTVAPTTTKAPTPTPTPFATAAPLAEKIDYPNQLENFVAGQFSSPTTVDNRWFPLAPGTQFIYDGSTEPSPGERVPHRFILTVSDLTKTVNGLKAVVVWDQDLQAGVLAEAELAFFVQNDDGNVWHLGQYPEVYENGKIVETPTWIAGVDGARPGITIKKEPQLGGPTYSQGWSPTVPWTDRARVAQVGVKNCVPAGCYENVIVTEEFSREEPDAFQRKYYAPGVGNIRVDFTGADQTRETLELTSVTQLNAEALADVRAKVLALEKSAYAQSKDVYGTTQPAS
jgi:hypothetical protein